MEELGGEGLAKAAFRGCNDATGGIRVAAQHGARRPSPVRAGFEAIVLFDALVALALRCHELGGGRSSTLFAKAHVLATVEGNKA